MQTQIQSTTEWAREYETIYILRPNVDPDSADKVGNRVAEVVERLNGKLTKVDNWGKRKLAYAIQKFTSGIFVYVRYVGYKDLVAEVERNLRLLDDVVRYQTVLVRDMIDPSTVEVDPDEVKFLRIEPTEDEPEPGIEQRLGLVPESEREDRRRPPPEAEPETDEAQASGEEEE